MRLLMFVMWVLFSQSASAESASENFKRLLESGTVVWHKTTGDESCPDQVVLTLSSTPDKDGYLSLHQSMQHNQQPWASNLSSLKFKTSPHDFSIAIDGETGLTRFKMDNLIDQRSSYFVGQQGDLLTLELVDSLSKSFEYYWNRTNLQYDAKENRLDFDISHISSDTIVSTGLVNTNARRCSYHPIQASTPASSVANNERGGEKSTTPAQAPNQVTPAALRQ